MKQKKTGKNKQCPYRNHCSNECYGDNPCDFAEKFDKMQRKINRLTDENTAMKAAVARMSELLDFICDAFDHGEVHHTEIESRLEAYYSGKED